MVLNEIIEEIRQAIQIVFEKYICYFCSDLSSVIKEFFNMKILFSSAMMTNPLIFKKMATRVECDIEEKSLEIVIRKDGNFITSYKNSL